MTKHILTKQQRNEGLTTKEDSDFLYIVDTTKLPMQTVATFSASGATIAEIQRAANDYLIERGTL